MSRRARPGPRLNARVLLPAALLAAFAGCADRLGPAARNESRAYPPDPQPPRVIALGTLRGEPSPSKAEVELAVFLFGAEPPPPLTIANPTALAAGHDALFIGDGVLDAVFRWDAVTDRVSELPLATRADHPAALDVAADGTLLLCDARGVVRFAPDGTLRNSFTPPHGAFRPAGILDLGDQVWVSNAAAHTIEVFDPAGSHRRTLGRNGRGPGEFALPRGLARTPDGHVCVVDMLNNRVQVLDRTGEWVACLGQAGDTPGTFGRPKDVAVGPDGSVFVTDAFSQRVHVFNSDGEPLLAFGEPGSGPGALAIPSGIAISTAAPQTGLPLPADALPAYYVFVGEQLDTPGVRVYAWLGSVQSTLAALPPAPATHWRPAFPDAAAINPHWDATRCDTCHSAERQTIPTGKVDALCLSCHDGLRAPAEPHPIGRPANTELVATPKAWPTPGETIGCLTCHDIQRHCDVQARRPAVNPGLLRGWDPQRPLQYCSECHRTDVGGRFSPHRQRDAAGRVRDDACLFCHTSVPQIPPDGRRQHDPKLRVDTSDLCLNCHTPHWDLSPLGHVDRPVTPAIRQWMLMREIARKADVSPAELASRARHAPNPPARLPLGRGEIVTCYTCHNPHYLGLFPADSELGAMAANESDRRAALRTDWIDLCSECHHH